MMMKWEEWWEKSITRGTSGDMVMDILLDWKEERNNFLKEIEKYLNDPEFDTDILTKLIEKEKK